MKDQPKPNVSNWLWLCVLCVFNLCSYNACLFSSSFFSPRFLCCVFHRHILVLNWHHSCREVVCVTALYSVDFVFFLFFSFLVFFVIFSIRCQTFKFWCCFFSRLWFIWIDSCNAPYKIQVRAVCERLLCKLFKRKKIVFCNWNGNLNLLQYQIVDWIK